MANRGGHIRSSARPTGVTKREVAIHTLILLAILVVLYPGVFLKGEVAVPGSLIYQYAPWSHHVPEDTEIAENKPSEEVLLQFTLWYSLTRQAIREGEWPLWHHLEFTGMPLLANYQSAVFYPTHVLHAVIDVFTAMTVYAVLKLWLCGFTAYLCARVMGLGRNGARFASIAWMCSGFNLTWCYWPEADVSAWPPVILMGVELLLQKRYRRGYAAMALGGTLLLLGGHPESAFVAALGIGLYMAIRLGLDRRRGGDLWRPPAYAAAAWASALLVASVQLIPFVDYLTQIHHRVGEGGLKPFLTPQALAVFLVPRFMGSSADGAYWGPHDNSNYVSLVYGGIVTWVAVSLLLSRGHSRQRLTQMAGLAAPAFVFGLMAFDVSIVRPLQSIPPFNAMWGIWFITFPMLALAILGGCGVDHWFSRDRHCRDLIAPLLFAGCAGGLLLWVYSLQKGILVLEGNGGYVRIQLMTAGVLALSALVIAAFAMSGHSRKTAAVLACGLLAVDLVMFGQDLLPTDRPDTLFPDTELTRLLATESPPYRVSVMSTPIHPGIMPNYGIAQLWGHDGMHPGRVIDLLGLAERGCWQAAEPLCAVRHYLFPEGTFRPEEGQFRLAETLEGIDVFINDRALPPAFLTGAVRALESKEALFDAMCDPSFDPKEAALTDAPPAETLPSFVGHETGRVECFGRRTNFVGLEVRAERRSVLVLADTYFNGWRAAVDGEPVEVFPVFHAFRGILVPPGHYEVVFSYRPMSFTMGLWISVAGMVLSCLYSLRRLRDRGK
ncbi:MAG: YfhO family protein [bacterium]|nr:YfhO family protein [bacterium]